MYSSLPSGHRVTGIFPPPLCDRLSESDISASGVEQVFRCEKKIALSTCHCNIPQFYARFCYNPVRINVAFTTLCFTATATVSEMLFYGEKSTELAIFDAVCKPGRLLITE
ncbi:hypothetical protein CEXT_339661 [Caerostris extrusa]|uniref:Uncharacterized protein n=1 Tax=Caerostris extrusa TaxID=172846 RepID=A0AAV4XPT1_CAEEX|nr:hypothetical protein CEXT_339661 [Caerostris extrusa]